MANKVFHIEQQTSQEASFNDQIERYLFEDLNICVSGKALSKPYF